MLIHCLFALSALGDVPELIVAWDQYKVEEQPQGFREACDEALGLYDGEPPHEYIDVEIDEAVLLDAFSRPILQGAIKPVGAGTGGDDDGD